MLREWIIFALCLGVGGHIALGMTLHAPGYWPWSTAGFYGLLSGVALYGAVQIGRALWKLLKHTSKGASDDGQGTSW